MDAHLVSDTNHLPESSDEHPLEKDIPNVAISDIPNVAIFGHLMPRAQKPKPETLNSKPLNPKPETSRPTPETPKSKT